MKTRTILMKYSFYNNLYFSIAYNILGDIVIKNINIMELKRLLPNINLIDIRSVEKYNDNHIEGAINIPKELLIKEYSKYLQKNKVYYIYCQQGKKSLNVCRLLTNIGYNVINIVGGYENWILNS